MKAALAIPPRQVQVWIVDLDRAILHPEWLSPEEQRRGSRFSLPVHQRRYLASRTILRSLLARYLDLLPVSVPLAATQHGKPFIAGSEVRFNLSHSDRMGLYAFSGEADLGVDLEKFDNRHCTEELARSVFTPDEFSRWMKLEATERAEVFFRVWTRKEAIVKATGEGLGRAPNTFSVPWTPEPAMANGVWLLPIPAPRDYQASLAVMTPHCPTVRLLG